MLISLSNFGNGEVSLVGMYVQGLWHKGFVSLMGMYVYGINIFVPFRGTEGGCHWPADRSW